MSLLVTLAPSPASAVDSGESMTLPSVDNLPPVQPAAPTDPATIPDLGPPAPAQKWERGKEILARRTANTKTFAGDLPGSYETKFFAEPVHFDNGDKWVSMDTGLRAGDGDTLENRANEFELNLAEQADSDSLARVEMDSDHSISMRLQGADDVEGDVSKNSVTYEDARTDTDLKLTSKRNGFKEELILSSADAPERFVYPLQLEGLTAAVEGAGDVVYRDGEGTERARTPHGFMYDSNVDPNSGEPAISNGVTFAIIPHGSGQALEVRLDHQWLNSPDREWPVTVDPDTYVFAQGDDTFVMSPFTQNYSSLNELKVGKPDTSSSVARAFLHFDTSQLNGVNVTSSYLFTREKHSWSPTQNPGPAYRVLNSSWTGASMTQFPGNATDDGSPATGAWLADGQTSPNRWAYWDITGIARNWAAANEDNGSVSIRASNEASNLTWKKYHSANTALATTPMITVAYTAGDPFGSTDDAVAVPGYGSGAANVFVRGWGIDPDTTGSIEAHAYAFKPDGTVAAWVVLNANKQRADVGIAYPGYGDNHGYDGYIPVPGPDTYTVCVALANVGQGTSIWLPCRSVRVDNYPGPAQNAQATANPDGTVKVTWVGPASNGNSAITGFNIQAFDANGTFVAYRLCSWGCRTATFNELVLGTSNTIKVYAQNAIGYSLESTPVNVVPGKRPNAPTNVSATEWAEMSKVSWTAPSSDGGSSITKMRITAIDQGGGSSPAPIECAGSCLTSSTAHFEGLVADHVYKFVVEAMNVVGGVLGSGAASVPSNAVTPFSGDVLTPTDVQAIAGDQQATVYWSSTVIGGLLPGVTAYTVKAYRAGDHQLVGTPREGIAGTEVTILGLTNGSPVYFRVTATTAFVVRSSESFASNVVTPIGSSQSPTDLLALPDDRQAELRWLAPAENGGSPVTDYKVEIHKNGESEPFRTELVGGPETTFTVTGLKNGTAHHFAVRAITAYSTPSAPSAASTPVVPAGVPFAASPPGATILGTDTVRLIWDPPLLREDETPGDNGQRITQYTVDAVPPCSNCMGTVVGGEDVLTTITGLNPATSYRFRVRATNLVGDGDWTTFSNQVTTGEVPDPPDPIPTETAPGAPANIQVVLGDKSATVSWDAPAGSSIYQYRVTIDPGGQFVDTQGQQAVFQDLDNRTSYSFKILPTNAQGDGPAGFSGTVPSLKARADAYMVGNLDDFLAIKSLQPAPFLWSDDGCSTPDFVEPEKFLEPCKRHDFGYRNYGAGGLELGGPFPQNSATWQWINAIFLKDMANTCNLILDTYCWAAAAAGYGGVSGLGFWAFYNGDS